jgi:hypothetical protein
MHLHRRWSPHRVISRTTAYDFLLGFACIGFGVFIFPAEADWLHGNDFIDWLERTWDEQ